ncbi:MAG: hypothetical protein AAGF23_12120 [Acidobacteriota bacterium]
MRADCSAPRRGELGSTIIRPANPREIAEHRALASTESAPELRRPLLAWIERCAGADGFLDAADAVDAHAPVEADPGERLGLRLGPPPAGGDFRTRRHGHGRPRTRDDGLFDREVAVKVADRRFGADGLERPGPAGRA